MPGVETAHDHTTGGCTDRRPGVVIGELHPLPGKAIDIGGLELFLSVAGEISVAGIIEEDVDDVGLLVRYRRGCQECGCQGGKEKDREAGVHGKRVTVGPGSFIHHPQMQEIKGTRARPLAAENQDMEVGPPQPSTVTSDFSIVLRPDLRNGRGIGWALPLLSIVRQEMVYFPGARPFSSVAQ